MSSIPVKTPYYSPWFLARNTMEYIYNYSQEFWPDFFHPHTLTPSPPSHPPHPRTLTGLQLLRSKPKKGVRFLQEKGLVGREAEEVAAFFHRDERVNRAAIGDYLGESDE